MIRIAIGGLQHETNTFSPTPATLRDFMEGGGWPGLQDGAAMFDGLRGLNLPITGALECFESSPEVGRAGLQPLLWAAATPSGRVADDAFETLAARMVTALAAAGPLDGLYLDLHGAMACTSHDDGEGALLTRLRAALGPDVPLVASLDMHANVSDAMIACCDALVVYRTYPHVDMAETGARAARLLLERIASRAAGRPWHKAVARVDYVAPLTAQCTLGEPAASVCAEALAFENAPHVASVSWACAFPLAEIDDARQCVLAYGEDATRANAAVDALRASLLTRREAFEQVLYTPAEAASQAVALARHATLPVVLVDTNDNPGGGGSSDTTGVLRALLTAQAPSAVVAILCDAAAAEAAHRAGVGASLTLDLGGKVSGGPPLHGCYEVLRLGDGCFVGTGPMWGGTPINLGPMALLRIDGVRVIVSSRKMQAGDRSIFAHLGIDPANEKILSLKSSVHFRADFDAITSTRLIVDAPGLCGR
ncbi:M81 family metallopeptidase [Chitinasiproducens palmae]|uniref:Microcystinase C n=1 Tax=Chitinasiproducens palmae TaxID=1770053 RepID=A0A1H2PK62_9BURK|nr:M81 family metallopeptidase [Chitinasiproducens palmae]SDV46733.1 Microcystin degradation protein MlrC, contains DUF1485 domain [Chitinasiproducens palmae]